jgi:subtilisin family serine protease
MNLRRLRLRVVGAVASAALLTGCEPLPPDGAGSPQDPDNSGPTSDSSGSVVTDELIVTTTPGADRDDLTELYAGQGTTVRDQLTELSVDLLGVDPGQRGEIADVLESSPLVEAVNDNRVIDLEVAPNDPDYALQWHLDAIEAPEAWATTTGDARVLVAVLDTGVDAQHVDLASQLHSGGNTYDGVSGWQDLDGHGTAIIGIIAAATDNSEGGASIAPDCPIMPIRVTDGGNRTTSWAIASGIALAVDQGARVINVSYSPSHHDEILLRQAQLAHLSGTLVVFSAGNTGERISGGGSDFAVWVGAVDQNRSLAEFSTFGDFVDLVAPGTGIYTTQLGDSYGSVSGSSFAAPIVSGVAALVWSVNPDLRPTTVQGILLTTATDLGPTGDDAQFGAGQVNARAAVELAQTIVEQSDVSPPTASIVEPAANAGVNGATTFQVQAADDIGVADVSLSVDDVPLASDAIAPYIFVVDTARYGLGQHEVSAVATDLAGNATEHRISVAFTDVGDDVAPSVNIVSPTEGAVVGGVITILADALDNRMLARADVLVDDQAIGTITLGSAEMRIAYNWNTAAGGVESGSHTITIRVFDTSENVHAASVKVNVSN